MTGPAQPAARGLRAHVVDLEAHQAVVLARAREDRIIGRPGTLHNALGILQWIHASARLALANRWEDDAYEQTSGGGRSHAWFGWVEDLAERVRQGGI